MANNLDQQQLADKFNNGIARERINNTVQRDGKTVETNADSRRAAQYALQRFEAAHWYPDLFDEALAELPAMALSIEKKEVTGSLDDMREVLERYVEIIEAKTGAPAIEKEFFTARHAAWYVARQLTRQGTPMTFAGIDKHIRVNKDLRGQIVGTSMLFTRQQLDEYVANFDKLPKRGRRSHKAVEG